MSAMSLPLKYEERSNSLRSVICPVCSAKPGQQCIVPHNGKAMEGVHFPRFKMVTLKGVAA